MYRGVVILVRLFHGSLNKGDRIRLMSNGREYDIEEIGYLVSSSRLRADSRPVKPAILLPISKR